MQLVLLRIGRLGSSKPAVDLGLEFSLTFLHALIAHRLVLGRVRLDLRTIERHMSELHQPRLFRKLQHLHEQSSQSLQMPSPELRYRTEIRRIPRHDHHEVGPLLASLGNPTRGIDPARIAGEQQRCHHARVEWRLAQLAPVAADQLGEIKTFPNQRDDKSREVARRHIILHACRQELRLIDFPGTKEFAHNSGQNLTRTRKSSDYSDRLLVSRFRSSHHSAAPSFANFGIEGH